MGVWRPNYLPELYHHGVKGMRWGVITKKDTSKERLGGRNKPKDGRDHYNKAEDTNNVATTAANLAINISKGSFVKAAAGAATLATTAAATAKIKANEIRTSKLETDPATGLKLKDPSKQWTQEQDMKAVNPGFLNQLSNGSRNNCMLCTLTYDLRRRGFDVTANFATSGYSMDDLKLWYPNSTSAQCTAQMYPTEGGGAMIYDEDLEEYIDETIEELKKTGEGARGALCVWWQQGSGHAMAYEIHNGEPVVYDCQTGEKHEGDNLRELLSMTYSSTTTRLDNVEPNPEYIKEVTHDDNS